jgi:hypothetical protein
MLGQYVKNTFRTLPTIFSTINKSQSLLHWLYIPCAVEKVSLNKLRINQSSFFSFFTSFHRFFFIFFLFLTNIQNVFRHIVNYYTQILPQDGRSQWPCGLRRGSWPVGCWDCGFESHSKHGCLSASFCFVLSYVGRGIATGWSLVHGVLPYV